MAAFKVLVLDDEPWQLEWVKDIASTLGGIVLFAATMEEACTLFDKEHPDLAIVDVRIGEVPGPPAGQTLSAADPQWVGLRFLRFVRAERKKRTRLFVYTGLDREEIAKIAEDAFNASFFTKFDSTEFRKALIKEFKQLKG